MEFLANYHPITVHFPIAFLIVYIISEIVFIFYRNIIMQQISFILLIIGIIGGIASVITGNLEFQLLQQNPLITEAQLDLVEQHSDMATFTMWYFFGILFFKTFILIKKKNKALIRYIFVIFVIAGGFILYQAADLGGQLVYQFGIGTELTR